VNSMPWSGSTSRGRLRGQLQRGDFFGLDGRPCGWLP
jgi:hypothetical protein